MSGILIQTMMRCTVFVVATAFALPAAAEQFIRVGGGLAGTYPIFAAKLVELINGNIPDVKANVVSGDLEKAQLQLEAGELDIALSPTFIVKRIFDGKASLGIPTPNVRHLITLYGSFIQPVTKPGGINSLSDLKSGSNRVWMGQKSGFFYQVFEPMLNASGVTVDDITAAGGVIESYGYLDEVQGFQDGRLEAGVFAGPIPYGLLLQIEQNPGFQLIGMDDTALNKLTEILPGMGRGTIPAGSYKGQDSAVEVPYYVNQLLASTHMSDDMAYQITKLMMDNYTAFHGLFAGSEEIDDKEVYRYNEIPVHPGAQKYLQEAGAE